MSSERDTRRRLADPRCECRSVNRLWRQFPHPISSQLATIVRRDDERRAELMI